MVHVDIFWALYSYCRRTKNYIRPFCLFTIAESRSLHSWHNMVRLSNSKSFSNFSWQHWARAYSLALYSSQSCWKVCSLFGKSFNLCLWNLNIIVWWTATSAATYLIDNVEFSTKVVLILFSPSESRPTASTYMRVIVSCLIFLKPSRNARASWCRVVVFRFALSVKICEFMAFPSLANTPLFHRVFQSMQRQFLKLLIAL